MRPTVAVVAADEPDTAANIVQPSTLTCSSLPGSAALHGASPLNSDSDSLVRNRISAIRMNSGSATSSRPVAVFQDTCASSFSPGSEEHTSEHQTLMRNPYP